MQKLLLGFILSSFFFISCEKDPPVCEYKTKYVVVIVVDGARYSETWGDPLHQFIPNRYGFINQAVICSEFYNSGTTNTINGHASILTGNDQNIDNSGAELPEYPSWLQHYRKSGNLVQPQSSLITSKDKLQVLANCNQSEWHDQFNPYADCGVSGLGSGYRSDSITLQHVLSYLQSDKPHVLLVNFREPDYTAHTGDSLGYLKGIRDTDSMAMVIWNYLENDPFYSGKTAFIITNDHGRHLPDQGGFAHHGDNCDGCRHVEFFALGPDFKKGYNSTSHYDLKDISTTIAELLHFEMPFSNGKVMWDVLDIRQRWE